MRLFFFTYMAGLAWTLIVAARHIQLSGRSPRPLRRPSPGKITARSSATVASATIPQFGSASGPLPARFFVLFQINGGWK